MEWSAILKIKHLDLWCLRPILVVHLLCLGHYNPWVTVEPSFSVFMYSRPQLVPLMSTILSGQPHWYRAADVELNKQK